MTNPNDELPSVDALLDSWYKDILKTAKEDGVTYITDACEHGDLPWVLRSAAQDIRTEMAFLTDIYSPKGQGFCGTLENLADSLEKDMSPENLLKVSETLRNRGFTITRVSPDRDLLRNLAFRAFHLYNLHTYLMAAQFCMERMADDLREKA